MKIRIFILFLYVFLMFGILPSCSKEDIAEPDDQETTAPGDDSGQDPAPEPTPDPEPDKPKINFVLSAEIEGDAAELSTWVQGDAVTAWSVGADGKYGYYGYSERDVVASKVDACTAEFVFTSLPQGGRAWLAFKSNSGYDGCSAMKIEFNHAATYTQPVAGEFPHDMLKLIGSKVDVPVYEYVSDTTVALQTSLHLAGTVLRNEVISSTGAYAEEKVESVQIAADNAYIAGVNNSAYAYNMLDGGKYWSDNSGQVFGDECVLIWENTSKTITTTVSAPVPVSEGKAVFMPAPPVKVGGYKYVVTTDVAIYTFDFSSEDLVFADGEVMRMELDLEGANVRRLAHADIKGELLYEGGMPESYEISYEEGVTGLGYWFARTKDKGASEFVTREARDAANAAFYENVRFVAIDDATGMEATWISVAYRSGDTWWDATAAANNEPTSRTATVTAFFDDVDGYLIDDAHRTKVVKVTQKPFSNIKTLDFWGNVGSITIEPEAGKTAWGYWVMTVNGTNAEKWSDEEIQRLYKSAEFRCYDYSTGEKGGEVDWLSVGYRCDASGNVSDTWWDIVAQENTSKSERKALVECVFPAMDDYAYANGAETYLKAEVVTQKANLDLVTEFESLLSGTVPAAGMTAAAARLTVKVDGVALEDVSAAVSQYNIAVNGTGGAKVDAISSDGTVTVVFSENKPSRERTCGLEVVYNGVVKASIAFTQEAGTSDVPAFTYEFGAWQKGHNGQYTVQFAKDQLDFEHWLAVFGNLKIYGETPSSMGESDVKALVMQLLGLDEAGYAAQPFRFRLEFGGAGESKLMISLKTSNDTGEMIVYEGDIYECDQATIINHYTVNHLP